MEKQPVDDLFARKLHDAEAPVSSDLFNRMQQRMGTKPLPVRRKIGAWWYVASAACALVAVCFLYLTNKPEKQLLESFAQKRLPEQSDVNRVVTKRRDRFNGSATRLQTIDEETEKVTKEHRKPGQLAKATYPDLKPTNPKSQLSAREHRLVLTQQVEEQIAVIKANENEKSVPAAPQLAISQPGIERVEQATVKPKQITERTILLTINEPQTKNELAASNNNYQKPDTQNQPNGLSGLFGKLKQLKNGEVMAKATPVSESNSTQKKRLGRVFTEVKESLKNETTLE
ncbi:hypothetical protein [Fibrella forsythiae]|uniref:Transmembrane protein n=1 Tax=Fibrella forsythiae TaxID=2817061 RepID=A0ABS3JFT8_9BACT|nr:hypothetical protein [Fibrella forsythiae]MBO0948301.1 hypothetical protein [Fibrella forsythiae]